MHVDGGRARILLRREGAWLQGNNDDECSHRGLVWFRRQNDGRSYQTRQRMDGCVLFVRRTGPLRPRRHHDDAHRKR
jgi:hypothetical protein